MVVAVGVVVFYGLLFFELWVFFELWDLTTGRSRDILYLSKSKTLGDRLYIFFPFFKFGHISP